MSTQVGFWNQKYDRSSFIYGRRPNQFLLEVASEAIPAGARVLSLGEGEGRNAVWLARQGYRVTAVDFSKPALEKLERFSAELGVSVDVICSDVVDFDFSDTRWDAVVILHLHLAPEPRRMVHGRVVEALCPGGVVLLEALRPEQMEQPTSGPNSREYLYSVEELRDDFADLEHQTLRSEDRFIKAGEHRGPTSVVSLLARKER